VIIFSAILIEKTLMSYIPFSVEVATTLGIKTS